MDKPSERSAVLLDPYPLWHEAVSQVLRRIGVEVVEATASPKRALTVLEERPVDMLILEVSTADSALDGITFLRQAREKRPGLRAIVLSSHEDAEHIDAALAAGAAAYVVKTAHPDDLASAVRQVFAHSIYLPGGRATQPAVPAVSPAPEPERAPQELSGLTRRELEILQLVSEGHSNAQLARMLWVTEQTVKFHLSNTYRKLGVANRTEASRYAHMHALVEPRERLAS